MDKFKIGDRVGYNDEKTSYIFTESHRGKTGVVQSIHYSDCRAEIVTVLWDNVQTPRSSPILSYNLHKRQVPTAGLTVEKAVAFLKTQGKVTFEKSWAPLAIIHNDKCIAVIDRELVTLKTAHMTPEALLLLADEVRKMMDILGK